MGIGTEHVQDSGSKNHNTGNLEKKRRRFYHQIRSRSKEESQILPVIVY
jgi:hypothetical protein